jgi:hypothetical protein
MSDSSIWKVPAGGDDYEPVPQGRHRAVCISIYDVGSQYSEKFKSTSHKIILGFELPDLKGEDGMPRTISKFFTFSLRKKSNFKTAMESWRGKKFTDDELENFYVDKLLGVPVEIQVLHEERGDRTSANINAFAPVKGKLKAEHPLVKWSVRELTHQSIPDSVPEWIRKLAERSEEYQALPKSPQGSNAVLPPENNEEEAEDDEPETPF